MGFLNNLLTVWSLQLTRWVNCHQTWSAENRITLHPTTATVMFTESSSRGLHWCKESRRLDTNSQSELQPLLHKHTHSPDEATVSEIAAGNIWAQIAPYSLQMFQHLATAGGALCLPSVDWLLVGSASSEATLVPGWGSTLTLFTFWKTQENHRLSLRRRN